ncbi:hypothetical protein OG429_20315 [Streptomyces sp. NBC_00190]|uniref:hypothetical protein n=1 Tax=unclassified Streptomyces TaxID=2593676 RepID=UPI002E2C711A|nr:hypothetical protein [Streptomyces sp. NBC_00190]WSZ41412.1 hypothetical protein OG239_23095 [Streptomyces sp. NBC_00868]
MPIDPYTALNAMLRAEAARFTPPVRQSDPAAPLKSPAAAESESTSEPQHTTAPDSAA